MKHMKGPWTADFSRVNGHLGITVYSEEMHIATVYLKEYQAPNRKGGEMNQPVNKETVANARLIAAAPELLEACKNALPALEWGKVHAEGNFIQFGVAIEKIKAAMVKAEGK